MMDEHTAASVSDLISVLAEALEIVPEEILDCLIGSGEPLISEEDAQKIRDCGGHAGPCSQPGFQAHGQRHSGISMGLPKITGDRQS